MRRFPANGFQAQLPGAPRLTWFQCLSAPNANLRAQLTASGCGKRRPTHDESSAANGDRRSRD